MTGIITGIKRMEIHDGDGIRTTVFFKGCPLKCIWCHNPESISFAPQVALFQEKCVHCNLCRGILSAEHAEACPVGAMVAYGKEYEAEALADILVQDRLFFTNSGGGVTLSGGECLAQPEFVLAVAKMLKERGISVYVDTCGFVRREVLASILPYTDKFLYDIKAIDPVLHQTLTGQSNQIILENLRFLSEQNSRIEIRYPLVKGYNDGECDAIGRFLAGIKGIEKIKVLKYHAFAGSRYAALGMKNTLPNTTTTHQDMEDAVAILKSYRLAAINGAAED